MFQQDILDQNQLIIKIYNHRLFEMDYCKNKKKKASVSPYVFIYLLLKVN